MPLLVGSYYLQSKSPTYFHQSRAMLCGPLFLLINYEPTTAAISTRVWCAGPCIRTHVFFGPLENALSARPLFSLKSVSKRGAVATILCVPSTKLSTSKQPPPFLTESALRFGSICDFRFRAHNDRARSIGDPAIVSSPLRPAFAMMQKVLWRRFFPSQNLVYAFVS
jgi:hypothetical protein